MVANTKECRKLSPQDQCTLILRYLKRGRKLTQLEALDKFGCMRLGARIYDLRAAGHAISSRMVDRRKRDGSVARVAEYSYQFVIARGDAK